MKLSTLLKINTQELSDTLRHRATHHGDLYRAFINDARPRVLIVAHYDIVHEEKQNKRLYHDAAQNIYFSPDGLGADDRAGIFAALRLYATMTETERPNLLLCDEEETGAHGARAAAHDIGDLLKQTTLCAIEIDRQGNNDVVFYGNESKQFKTIFKRAGFKKEHGTFSDVSILSDSLNISSANISAGYHHQHTKHEILDANALSRNIDRAAALIRCFNRINKKWRHETRPLFDFKSYKDYSRDYLPQKAPDHVNLTMDSTYDICYVCNRPITFKDLQREYCPYCDTALSRSMYF